MVSESSELFGVPRAVTIVPQVLGAEMRYEDYLVDASANSGFFRGGGRRGSSLSGDLKQLHTRMPTVKLASLFLQPKRHVHDSSPTRLQVSPYGHNSRGLHSHVKFLQGRSPRHPRRSSSSTWCACCACLEAPARVNIPRRESWTPPALIAVADRLYLSTS
jgi:hypothetical protein